MIRRGSSLEEILEKLRTLAPEQIRNVLRQNPDFTQNLAPAFGVQPSSAAAGA
jgi:hypothetical protein